MPHPTHLESFLISGVIKELSKSLNLPVETIILLSETPLTQWGERETIHLAQIQKRAPRCVETFIKFLPE